MDGRVVEVVVVGTDPAVRRLCGMAVPLNRGQVPSGSSASPAIASRHGTRMRHAFILIRKSFSRKITMLHGTPVPMI